MLSKKWRVYAPLTDAQQQPPAGYCTACGWELWGDEANGRALCPQCREEEIHGKLHFI